MREALVPQAGTPSARPSPRHGRGWVRTILIDHADDPALIAIAA